MNVFSKLFPKKKDIPSLEKYLSDVDRISKQADALHDKAKALYNKTGGHAK